MSTKITVQQSSNIILFLIVVALCVFGGIYYYKYTNQKSTVSMLSQNAISLTEKVKTYKVKLDDTAAVFVSSVHQITLDRDNYKKLYGGTLKTINKLDTRIDELQRVSNVSTASKDSVKAEIVYIDSVGTRHAEYTSKWIDITCTIDKRLQSQFTYEKRDSLLLIKEVDQVRILWGLIHWKKPNSEVYKAISFDPKETITGLKIVEILK